MVQVLPYVPGFGEKLVDTLSQAGGNVAQGYFQGQRKKSDLKLIEEIGNNPNDPFAKQFGRISKLSPDTQKTFAPLYSQLMKNENMSKERELDRQTQINKAQITAAAKGQKLSPFENKVQQKSAEEYSELSKTLPRLQDSLKNLDKMEQLSQNFRGPGGYAKGLFGAGGASEFDSMGLISIEPFLKILNPVGAIPVQKINLIRDKAAPKAWEPQWIIEGKINALRRFTQQAAERAQNRLQAYQQYGGVIPPQIEAQLNAQDSADADSYDEELNSFQKAEKQAEKTSGTHVEKLPPRGAFPGQEAKDPQTGKVLFVWDGKHWNKA